jgi:rSAM/selenodomain-associated transferase 1
MDQLGLFAKYWQPGGVKTRLARKIGARAASGIYQTFIATVLQRLGRLSRTDLRRVLAYWPVQRRDDFAALAGDWQLMPQCEGDLGQRMRQHFDDAFAAGARRVVLLGTDSPNIPLPIIEQAYGLLREHALVLGPAEDGGYYLIGASAGTPDVFAEIDWSSSHVWRQTTQRADRLRLDWAALPSWYDVDTPQDLARLIAELSTTADPALAALRAKILKLAQP